MITRNIYVYGAGETSIMMQRLYCKDGQLFPTKCCSYESHMAFWNKKFVPRFCVHHTLIQDVPLDVELMTACSRSSDQTTGKWVSRNAEHSWLVLTSGFRVTSDTVYSVEGKHEAKTLRTYIKELVNLWVMLKCD